ncbi:A/G-specific adenine glycosylase [Lysinibacillus sphaericus]|uniref:Adenine DNA glycosylase n=1 Tax=Lysinibacillus sphaericus TaxID=1421 RepID=A0A2S0JWA6_LYSSH|nr:A/G-specific adenine glycosylase [Lysinibacillus sphaericus]AVK95427.1 A/G-specific adenine glycosylase [Lysinibacillus sphaericus]MCS1383294.1 A/G-specific adenine glycosylase [Lysinibacillus sphaericus]MED4546324.1 A/G-specific adenine glycosylase [Lysinibacillus sphaericus]TKI19317.1 A/G-specific adenine glycosylase [Lysinibacillus sphaericus]SUV19007.1 A/G-specific adenine glycosylase [Lysinibacillus sphaericus]
MNYPYVTEFRQSLVEWFEKEKRDLPWRHTKDPYKIWVSEVMLQQTRVDTVIPYYNRFMESFPTLELLAEAPQEYLLKHWEGLGYYSRARNLQAGVREVLESYGGIVPDNRHEISKLKGIGPYTAGAILSIAYNKPEHAVDGNVMRVLSRVLNIHDDIALPKTKKIFEAAVEELIDSENASSFNQGLMELGALICSPTSPKCLLCPVREYCTAFNEGEPENLPIKSKKIKMKHISYDVFVCEDEDGRILMEQRPEEGLLANMWQFPMVEQEDDSLIKFAHHHELNVQAHQPILTFKHIFSHLTWDVNAYYMKCKTAEKGEWLTREQIELLPMPVPMLKIWQAIK